MKIVYYESRLAKLLLRGGYPTIMLFGFVLTKRPALDERSLRHEEIHAVQWGGGRCCCCCGAVVFRGGWCCCRCCCITCGMSRSGWCVLRVAFLTGGRRMSHGRVMRLTGMS